MQDYYEINVAKNGQHLFATAERSIPSYDIKKFEEVYTLFCKKFPESEGYEISVTLWKCSGHVIQGKW